MKPLTPVTRTLCVAASTVSKPPSVEMPGRFCKGCGKAPAAGGMLNGEPSRMWLENNTVQLAPAVVSLVSGTAESIGERRACQKRERVRDAFQDEVMSRRSAALETPGTLKKIDAGSANALAGGKIVEQVAESFEGFGVLRLGTASWREHGVNGIADESASPSGLNRGGYARVNQGLRGGKAVASNVASIEPFRNAGRCSEVPVAQSVYSARNTRNCSKRAEDRIGVGDLRVRKGLDDVRDEDLSVEQRHICLDILHILKRNFPATGGEQLADALGNTAIPEAPAVKVVEVKNLRRQGEAGRMGYCRKRYTHRVIV